MKHLKVSLVILAVGIALTARPTYAHGFGERYDLPVPLNLFLAGAAATVALSFVVIGLFVRHRSENFSYPRYNLLKPRWLAAILTGRVLLTSIRTGSVALFLSLIHI